MSDTQTRETLIRLVERIMAENAIAIPVQAHSRLVDLGLTSIDMVNLMLAVEAEFDMMIPPVDIRPENFQSVDTMERLIGRVR